MADVAIERLDDGAIWRVTFSNGKGNVLDGATMQALAAVFVDAKAAPGLKAIVLEGAGKHFSFGASVTEHLPDQVGTMLARFRELAFAMLDCHITIIAAVRGQCLGGGLEVVTLCHQVVAHADAMFGQPEIVLGVFAPMASIILADRVGQAHAEELCLTGRTVDAGVAHGMGIVNVIDEQPAEAAVAWARAQLGAKSASSLRFAVRAVRMAMADRVRTLLPAMERLYLDDLMRTADAVEGLQAFLDKRPPSWRHQ